MAPVEERLVFGRGFTEEEIRLMGLDKLWDVQVKGVSGPEGDNVQGGIGVPIAAVVSSSFEQLPEEPPDVASPSREQQQNAAATSWAERLRKNSQPETMPKHAAEGAHMGAQRGGRRHHSRSPGPKPQGRRQREVQKNVEAMAEAADGAGEVLLAHPAEEAATDDKEEYLKEEDAREEQDDAVPAIPVEAAASPVPVPSRSGSLGHGKAIEAIEWLASAGEAAVRELDGQGTAPQPRGLVNNGNACFMNSTLQALVACPIIAQILGRLADALPSLSSVDMPTLCALGRYSQELGLGASSSGSCPQGPLSGPPRPAPPLNPTCMDAVIRAFCPSMAAMGPAPRSGEPDQHDAQEFLTYMLDHAHQELQSLRKLYASDLLDRSPAGGSGSYSEDDGWEQVGRGNRSAVTRGQAGAQGGTTAISAVFGGALRSEVRAVGARPSATKQHFTVLPLDIYPDQVDSVDVALSLLTSPETISDYRAEGTKQATDASKRVQLLQLPQVLVLHLMRFTYGATGTGKLHKKVAYDTVLHLKAGMLADGCTNARGRATYDLLAVVQHHGRTPFGGHYTTDARWGGPRGPWMHFNDSSVTAVAEEEVLHGHAYLLFYSRRHS